MVFQDLPGWLHNVTRLHQKFIPTQASHPGIGRELADQLCDLRVKLGLPPSPLATFLPWIESELVALGGCERHHPGSVPISDVLAARCIMTGAAGHLVGVPIDKNRIFYFEDAAAYRQR